MENKQIAQYARSFIGGKPTVYRYYNEDETNAVDIMTCTGTALLAPVCATIGLHQKDTGLYVDDRRLGVELMIAARVGAEALEELIAAVALTIEGESLRYGELIELLPPQMIFSEQLQYLVLLSPPFWPKYEALESGDELTAWLYVLPITEDEADYLKQNSVSDFEQLLEQANVDVLDPNRVSCV